MVVCICDAQECCVARLFVEEDGKRLRVEGDFPGGLTPQDLAELGFVYYETNTHGELVARVKEVAPADSLDYLRALLDALPPGYHINQVESKRIERERQQRRARFEEELALMSEEE
ncbi:MAG: hypothetical protein AB7S38_20930 [Vulcanimicrobiota bacterium]